MKAPVGAAIVTVLCVSVTLSGMTGILKSIHWVGPLVCYGTLLLGTISTRFAREGTPKHKALVIGIAAVSYIVAMFVPYATLVNIIFTYAGYAGAVMWVLIMVQYIRKRCSGQIANPLE